MADLACPTCRSLTSGVTNTRSLSGPVPGVHRRRRCARCKGLFSTYETTRSPDAPPVDHLASEAHGAAALAALRGASR